MSTPLTTAIVPNWCRMPYMVASQGTPAFSRKRRSRSPSIFRRQGLPWELTNTCWVVEGLLPLDAFKELCDFRYHLDDSRARRPQKFASLVLGKDDHAMFKIHGIPGECRHFARPAPVYRRKNSTLRNRVPAVGRFGELRRLWPLGNRRTVARISLRNSSSVMGRRASPGRWVTPKNGLAEISRCRAAQLNARCTILMTVARVQADDPALYLPSSHWVRWIGRHSLTSRKPWASANNWRYWVRRRWVSTSSRAWHGRDTHQ